MAEPEPRAGRPEPPEWFDELARSEWERIVPELEAMGLLYKLDGSALELLCDAWSRYQRARLIVADEGLLADNGKGQLIKHPAVQVAEQAFGQWKALMAQFGLAPAARANLAIERKNPDENRGKKRFFEASK